MRRINWDSIIDKLQISLVFFVILVVAISTCTLILFDIVVPAGGTMNFLTNKNETAALGISFATTGLLMALMFIGYTLLEKKNTAMKNIGIGVLIAAAIVYVIDIIFDALSADIFRFGYIVGLKDIPDPIVHVLFRLLIGGISTIGEGLAIAIIVGMPILKTLINDALPISSRQPYQSSVPQQNRYNAQSQAMSNIPRQKPVQAARPAAEPTYHPISYASRSTNSKSTNAGEGHPTFSLENYDFGTEE